LLRSGGEGTTMNQKHASPAGRDGEQGIPTRPEDEEPRETATDEDDEEFDVAEDEDDEESDNDSEEEV
jgi:hypothetical protein